MSNKRKILIPAHFVPHPTESNAVCIRLSDGTRTDCIKTPDDAEREIALNVESGRLTGHEASELRQRSRQAHIEAHESTVHLFLSLITNNVTKLKCDGKSEDDEC